MSSNPVALILGSGPRVGAAVAKQFASTGYFVAIASRTATGGEIVHGYLSIKAELQSAPSVVVYLAAAFTPPAGDDLFSIPAASLAANLNTNTVSVYAAAREAVKGWETLMKDAKKVFNLHAQQAEHWDRPDTPHSDLGHWQVGFAYLIGAADTQYSKLGYHFFYADERNPDGSQKGMQIDGDANADFFAQLARGEGEVPWRATFVKGHGYVKF